MFNFINERMRVPPFIKNLRVSTVIYEYLCALIWRFQSFAVKIETILLSLLLR